MAYKIKLTADSTCDLSPELIEKYQVEITPLYVNLGKESYKDGIDIKPPQIYQYVTETGQLPKTSAVNIAEYADVFTKWRQQGYEVIHFGISSEMSSTYQNATVAAQQVDGIYTVDSRSLSTGIALLVIKAAEKIEQGLAAAEIAQQMQKMAAQVESSFIIDTLTYLHKGGRCSSLVAMGANLLHLKPCIEVINGSMDVGKKYRGSLEKCLEQYVTQRLQGRRDLDYSRIFITHSGCDKRLVDIVADKIRAIHPQFKEILTTVAGCTISTHCGPNTLGILFIRSK